MTLTFFILFSIVHLMFLSSQEMSCSEDCFLKISHEWHSWKHSGWTHRSTICTWNNKIKNEQIRLSRQTNFLTSQHKINNNSVNKAIIQCSYSDYSCQSACWEVCWHNYLFALWWIHSINIFIWNYSNRMIKPLTA